MSDIAELWDETKEARKEESRKRKQRNLNNALEQLAKSGISSKSSDGNHYVIEGNIDYWPTTGLFINRKTKKKGRGIRKLIKAVRGLA